MSEFEETPDEMLEPTTETNPNTRPEEPTKSYAGWVTASAFAAISTLFGVLWQTQTRSYNTAREDLREFKSDAKADRKSDSIIIKGLREDLVNCDDNALTELEKKMKQAERLRLSVVADYSKINKEVELSKENTAILVKATNNVKNAIRLQK